MVVHPFYVGIIGYGQAFMVDNSARVDVFVEKESGNARFCFDVNEGPVDGGSSTILGE